MVPQDSVTQLTVSSRDNVTAAEPTPEATISTSTDSSDGDLW